MQKINQVPSNYINHYSFCGVKFVGVLVTYGGKFSLLLVSSNQLIIQTMIKITFFLNIQTHNWIFYIRL